MDSPKLICPRCRHLNSQGQLFQAPLLCADQSLARPGALAQESSLHCANSNCHAQYPVIKGIPAILSHAGVLAHAESPLLYPYDLPIDALAAALDGADRSFVLAEHTHRIGRFVLSAFGDHTDLSWPQRCSPHGIELVEWLQELVDEAFLREHWTLSLGAAVGREAWALDSPTLLSDAHLPSLLATQALLEGPADFLIQSEPGRWQRFSVNPPAAPQSLALVCCDAANPPFEAEQFGAVLAANLVDSVHDPFTVLGQAAALTHPQGRLIVTTPFAWREAITPAKRWLSHGYRSSDEGLLDTMRRVAPYAELEAKREFTWGLWNSAREAVHYRSQGYSFRWRSESSS